MLCLTNLMVANVLVPFAQRAGPGLWWVLLLVWITSAVPTGGQHRLLHSTMLNCAASCLLTSIQHFTVLDFCLLFS